MEKLWRPIPGYERNYSISNYGEIKNLRRGRLLTPKKPSNGRVGMRVALYNNSKPTSFYVHRLTASAFLPVEDGRHVVNHIDGNYTNNRLDNLEWCTQKENIHHSRNISKHGAVVSLKKIKQLMKENPMCTKDEFVRLLLKECK
jgi:hypothetical protein